MLSSVFYLVLKVGVTERRDEDPGDAGVTVPGRGVQRGVAVLRRKEQNCEVQLNSWVVGWLVCWGRNNFLLPSSFS